MQTSKRIKNYARTQDAQPLPSLIDVQLDSYQWFIEHGLIELFDEISPIESFNGNLRLYFPGSSQEAQEFGLTHWFEEPKYPEDLCLERDMSYAAPLYVRVALVNRDQGDEVITADIFMGDFPLMTEKGTFIINGTERIVVSQLIRSPGVYFDSEDDRTTGRRMANAKLIPDRGAWMEFETRKNDYLTIKFNRKRTVPVTVLLRALAAVDDGRPADLSPIKEGTDEEILALYEGVDTDEVHTYLTNTIKQEPVWEQRKGETLAEAALLEFYRKMRPGDPPTLDNARDYLISQLFDQRRYDLERVGRYKLNKRLQIDGMVPLTTRTITKADIVKVVERMIMINNNMVDPDDIDHLGNRRVKTVGELIQNKLRVGLRRMERVVKERMSIKDNDNLTPVSLVNIRPVVASIREFFGSSQLSQFMEQTNPLAELTHKRTLSALGPGGLRRERAGFDVRDVHHSHYGRICPIETPEGPNIGLIGRLASYGRVNEYGFIETPYRKVIHELAMNHPDVPGNNLGYALVTQVGAEAVTEDDLYSFSNLTARFAAVAEGYAFAGAAAPVPTEVIEAAVADGVTHYAAGDKFTDNLAAELRVLGVQAVLAGKSAKDRVPLPLFNPDLADTVLASAQGSAEADTPVTVTVLNALLADGKDRVAVRTADGEENTLTIVNKVGKGLALVADLYVVPVGTTITDTILTFIRRAGFLELPLQVPDTGERHVAPSYDPNLLGRMLGDDIEDDDDEMVFEEKAVIDEPMIVKLRDMGLYEVPVRPFVSMDSRYMSADEEDHFVVAQANAVFDEYRQFVEDRVSSRYNQKFTINAIGRIDYVEVAPRQIVDISAALIPFLEHDDANRALMGSNMQRQAVPLLRPDRPIVSTGMERQAAYDSGQVIVTEHTGEVVSVQGDKIIIRTEDGEDKIYRLRKYDRSNQSTCVDQKPIVNRGDWVTVGDVIVDSSSTEMGALALGQDVLTAFISWEGGNYEDALLISEQLLRDDKFTSIHIEKHEVEARDTKLGPEEITYDIPNVGEDALKDLDERGVVRVGAEVGPNDILVGKITPKGEKELSPEEKLLRAIFGEQAREVKDTSLRMPHGDQGKVVDVKEFTRDEHRDLPAGVERMVRVSVAQRRKLNVGDKMAGRHGNKGVISKVVPLEDMPFLEDGRPVEIILNPLGVPGRMNIGQVLEIHLGWAADRLGFRAVTPVFDGAKEWEIQSELGRAWLIDHAWAEITERAWAWLKQYDYDPIEVEDDEEVRRLYCYEWLKDSKLYNLDEIMQNRVAMRRAVLAEWLREKGYNPEDLLVFDTEAVTVEERTRRDENAFDVSLREWAALVYPEYEIPQGLERKELEEHITRIMFETREPAPVHGKMKLYDGKTGEVFDRAVTVGIMHILKLAHLVEDKVHARSTGPYSLVTQQPLGGKAQFGGQRFGEMEVWALEAYGAAYILQEMLTVKSDDVQGRVKTYEAIVKGEPIEDPGIPTSFRVLVKELQSLGLAVEAITTDGSIIKFGKDEEEVKPKQHAPKNNGLLSISSQPPTGD